MSAPAARGLRGRAFRRRGARRFEDEAVAYAQVVAGAEDSVPAGQHELVVREHYPAARHVVGGAGAAAREALGRATHVRAEPRAREGEREGGGQGAPLQAPRRRLSRAQERRRGEVETLALPEGRDERGGGGEREQKPRG